ncbi:MAG: fumarylacetoacetate hydrolase family protein [Gammaproteobacteria bacterium]
MEQTAIDALGDELYTALRERRVVPPLTGRPAPISVDDAYGVSMRMLARREADGERVIGAKIGVTSRAVQDMLGVYQPDFGLLTDRMRHPNGADVPISRELIQPRVEGEIAFLLRHDLAGPGVTAAQVLHATEGVLPCFEIVDSRIEGWKIRIEDTIADNASCGLFVTGDTPADPRRVDLPSCTLVLENHGEVIATGAGAAAMGSPLNTVAWLANALGRYGIALRAGDIVLSGSLVPLLPVKPGDRMRVSIAGVGSAEAWFS